MNSEVKIKIPHYKEIPYFETGDYVAYGIAMWELVRRYLMTAYSDEIVQTEIVAYGYKYKILKRSNDTAFCDEDDSILFYVTNDRLRVEYEGLKRLKRLKNREPEVVDPATAESKEGDADEEDDSVVEQTEADPEAGEAPKTGHAEDEKEGSSADKTETVKSYSSGEEKLIAEEDEMLASVKPEFKKVMQAQMDLIFKELISWTKQDPEFEKKVLLNHKSMKRCMKFCADKAMGLREPSDKEKAAARNNNIPIMTPVGSDMLFEWIKEYYDKDDKAEVEKEKKAATAQKKSADKKKAVEKKKAAVSFRINQR